MALQTLQAPCLIGEQVRTSLTMNLLVRAISSMAISSAPGTTFAFEFIDNPDDEGSASKEGKRSLGDQYATSGNVDGNDITLFMNEAMFQPGIDVTNGDTFKIEVTEVTAGTRTPATVTPVSVTGPNPDPLALICLWVRWATMPVWVLDYNVGPMSEQFSGDWAAVSANISDLGGTWLAVRTWRCNCR